MIGFWGAVGDSDNPRLEGLYAQSNAHAYGKGLRDGLLPVLLRGADCPCALMLSCRTSFFCPSCMSVFGHALAGAVQKFPFQDGCFCQEGEKMH